MIKPCDERLSEIARKFVSPELIGVCRSCGVSGQSRVADLRIYTDIHEGVFWAMCCGCDLRRRAVNRLAIAVNHVDRSLSRNYEASLDSSSCDPSADRNQLVILPVFTRQWHMRIYGDGSLFGYRMIVRSDALPIDRHLPYLAKRWKRRPLSCRGLLTSNGDGSRVLKRLHNAAVEFRVMRNVLAFDMTLGRHAWTGLSCGVKALVRAKIAGRGRRGMPPFCSASAPPVTSTVSYAQDMEMEHPLCVYQNDRVSLPCERQGE